MSGVLAGNCRIRSPNTAKPALLRRAAAATALLMVAGLLRECGGDSGSTAFGSFGSASDSNEFNLEDVQPDWWPKIVPGFTAEGQPVMN